MASGLSLFLRGIGGPRARPVHPKDKVYRDRSLNGKARIKARKAKARKAAAGDWS